MLGMSSNRLRDEGRCVGVGQASWAMFRTLWQVAA